MQHERYRISLHLLLVRDDLLLTSNMILFCLVLHSFAFWLSGRGKSLVWTSAFAILIFRSELVVLLGLILLQEVFIRRRLPFTKTLVNGLIASVLAIGK